MDLVTVGSEFHFDLVIVLVSYDIIALQDDNENQVQFDFISLCSILSEALSGDMLNR